MSLGAGVLWSEDCVNYSESFGNTDLVIVLQPDTGYSKIKLNECVTTGKANHPNLPSKGINLIIPAGKEISNLNLSYQSETISGKYFIEPAPYSVPTDGTPIPPLVPDANVYNQTSAYPAEIVEIIGYDYIDGANKVAHLKFNPIQYLPSDSTLTLNSEISISLEFTSTTGDNIIYPQFKIQKNYNLFLSYFENFIDNPQDLTMFMHNPTILTEPRDNDNDYIIIAPNDFIPFLTEFIEWKTTKGLSVKVVSIEEIEANYTGDNIGTHPINDTPGKIREFLKDEYITNSLMYCLFITNSNYDFRKGSSRWGMTGMNFRDDIQTLFYFSEFNGDWNLNENPFWGEEITEPNTGDYPDYMPEIYVGGLRLNSIEHGGIEELENWIKKQIIYETNPGYGDKSYLMKAFGVDCDDLYYTTTLQPIDEYMEIKGFSYELWHEDEELLWPTGSEVISKLNEHHGFISFDTHGAPSHFKVLHTTSTAYYVTAFDTQNALSYEDNNGIDCTIPDNKYGVLYTIACLTGRMGLNTCAKIFTSHSDDVGGVVFIGNTNKGWTIHSPNIRKKFMEENYGVNIPFNKIGISNSFAKLWQYTNFPNDSLRHYLTYSNNIVGDPEMSMWMNDPQELSIIFNQSINSITVVSENNPIPYILVSFTNKNTEDIEFVYTDINGIATTSLPNYDRIYVSRYSQETPTTNYLPYIVDLIRDNSVWDENKVIRNNVIICNNSTLTITNGAIIDIKDYYGKSASITIEENATLIIENNSIIIGNKKTTQVNNCTIPGNKIIVKGKLNANNVEIKNSTQMNATFWDGIDFINSIDNSFDQCNISKTPISIGDSEVFFTDTIIEDSSEILLNNSTINITSCEYSNNSSPIECTNSIVNITGSEITGNSGGGIDLKYCSSNLNVISSNIINNNGGNGINLYESTSIISQNAIQNNSMNGLWLAGNIGGALVSTNNISNNNMAEVFSFVNSFPNLYSLGSNTVEDLVSGPGYDQFLLLSFFNQGVTHDVRNNIIDTSEPNRFYPSINNFYFGQIIRGDIDYFTEAISSLYNGEYSIAKEKMKFVISEEQGIDNVIRALYWLVYLENLSDQNYVSLRNYFNSLDFGENTELENAKIRANNHTYMLETDYISAINNYELVINNSSTIQDSVFTILDEGYCYLKLQENGSRELPSCTFKPQNIKELKLKTEELISLLLGSNKEEEPKNKLPIPYINKLSQNYPNPFNPTTTISFSIKEESDIEVSIFNLKGQKIKTLINERKNFGDHFVEWNGNNDNNKKVASGIYFYKLSINGKPIDMKKCLLLK